MTHSACGGIRIRGVGRASGSDVAVYPAMQGGDVIAIWLFVATAHGGDPRQPLLRRMVAYELKWREPA